jgi:cellulose synthase (UDP-forming)
MTDFAPFALFIATAGFFIAVVPFLPRKAAWARTLVVAIGIAVSARYFCWRLLATVLPTDLLSPAGFWYLSIYACEIAAFFNQFLFQTLLTGVADRSTEADRYEKELRARPADQLPTVDVFICTFNEGLDVVERTIVAALALDYPRFKVWVLDDGDRDWLRDFCGERGAGYIRRSEHRHAKAGNINHALAVTSGEVFAVLDADFAPFHNFLYRTLGFFADPRIGIVQTPQHFFNPDPIQFNLGLTTAWPDDQRLFFDVILPSRDAWDCAWCCGSCSVQRRDVVLAAGGVPTDSITEDFLSTIVLLRRGYVTRYLNERLTMGLAPENLEGYFRQRERWCRGNLQTLFLKSGPLGPGLTFLQRLFFLPVDWVVHHVIRLLMVIIPVIYLWTGVGPFVIPSMAELLSYQLPVLVAFLGGIRWFAPNSYLPILSTASSLFTSFRVVPAGLATLIKPFGTPFRVTPKGSGITFGFGDVTVLVLVIGLMILTLGGLIKNRIAPSVPDDMAAFQIVGEAWALANLVVLAVTALIAIESPRQRKEERFPHDRPAAYRVRGVEYPCRVRDISASGALLDGVGSVPADGSLEVLLDGVGAVPAQVVRATGYQLAVCFEDVSSTKRDRLIRSIFAMGRYNAVGELRPWKVVLGLLHSFARE